MSKNKEKKSLKMTIFIIVAGISLVVAGVFGIVISRIDSNEYKNSDDIRKISAVIVDFSTHDNKDDDGDVKYTTYKWLRPNGECIDEAGIDPKYGVELEIIKDEEGKVKEVHDTQYTKAIEIMSNKDIN